MRMSLSERPNDFFGGTMKEELQAELIMDFIRRKCRQHKDRGSCRWCPFWFKDYERCVFGMSNTGMSVADNWDTRR